MHYCSYFERPIGLQYGLSLPYFTFVQTNLKIQEVAYIFDGTNCH